MGAAPLGLALPRVRPARSRANHSLPRRASSMRHLAWLRLAIPLPLVLACSDGQVTTADDLDTSSGGSGGSGGTGGDAGVGGAAGGAGAPGQGGSGGSTTSSGSGGGMTLPEGLGVGEDCSEDACRLGLVCEDDVCELGGSTE